MIGNVGTLCRAVTVIPELINDVRYHPRTACDNLDPRSREDLVRIRSAGARKYMRDFPVSDHLRGLDARPAAQGCVVIFNCLKAQVIGIDDQKIPASSKPSINSRVEGRSL